MLEAIDREARQLDPRRVALTLLTAPLLVVGWLACKLLRVAWLAFAWAWTAGLVGWRVAGGLQGLPGRPDRSQVAGRLGGG
jgi:hypothetical protein